MLFNPQNRDDFEPCSLCPKLLEIRLCRDRNVQKSPLQFLGVLYKNVIISNADNPFKTCMQNLGITIVYTGISSFNYPVP